MVPSLKKCSQVQQQQRQQSTVKVVCSESYEPLTPARVCSDQANLTDDANVTSAAEPGGLGSSLAGSSSKFQSKDLSQIVADPSMPEAKWMAACVIAGEKSLVPRASFAKRFWTALQAGSGVIFSLLTVFLSFIVALFFAGYLAWFFCGVDLNTFMNAKGDGLGLLVTVFGGLSFWSALLFRNRMIRRLAVSVSAVMLGLAAIGYGSTSLGALGGSLMAFLSILFIAGFAHMGAVLKDALPRSFDAKQFAGSQMAVLSLPAVLMVCLLWSMSTSPTNSSAYDPADIPGLFMNLGILSFCVVLPGIAIARASLSKSLSACATLATSVQMPVLAGLLVATVMTCFDPLGLTKAVFLIAALAITAALAVGGAVVGVAVNRRI